MTVLVWFRTDLRVSDHPALHAALATEQPVYAALSLPLGQFKAHELGASFVRHYERRLHALSDELGDLGVTAHLLAANTFDETPEALLNLCRQLDVQQVYANRELLLNEMNRDRAVATALKAADIGIQGFDDQCVVQPGTLLTGQGKTYTVFSPFFKKWKQALIDQPPICLPKPKPRNPVRNQLPLAPDLTQGDYWPVDAPSIDARLQSAARVAARYDTERDAPQVNGTTQLSPYLAIGAISARQVVSTVLREYPDALTLEGGPQTLLSEIAWRDFYRHLVRAYPRLCKNEAFQTRTANLPWRRDEALFNAWREGRTGIPIVDAGMRQLKETGWMHNRVRMIVAMFLTKNLLIDWRLGEQHFLEHLVDADFASNNGGWQWSASTGTDAAPYFRIMNPVSQSLKHDPNGDYIRRWVPELRDLAGKAIHEPFSGKNPPRLNYPRPIVDLKESRAFAIEWFKQHQQESA